MFLRGLLTDHSCKVQYIVFIWKLLYQVCLVQIRNKWAITHWISLFKCPEILPHLIYLQEFSEGAVEQCEVTWSFSVAFYGSLFVLFLLTIVLSVLLRITNFDFPFDILKPFLYTSVCVVSVVYWSYGVISIKMEVMWFK
jgi:hypothetical protein